MADPFTLSGRLRSVRHAVEGIRWMLASQHNARVHLAATLAVVGAGLWVGLGRLEWCWIVVACVLVWSAEALNSAIESLCDVVSPELHPGIKRAKDVAAGGVLVTALGAVAIGLFVFGPRFFGAPA